MQAVIEHFEPLRRFGARLGPYVLLELLLPGGTLFALLLFVHRHFNANAGNVAAQLASPPALVSTSYAGPLQCDHVTRSVRRWCCAA
jgi:hypothetical protein